MINILVYKTASFDNYTSGDPNVVQPNGRTDKWPDKEYILRIITTVRIKKLHVLMLLMFRCCGSLNTLHGIHSKLRYKCAAVDMFSDVTR